MPPDSHRLAGLACLRSRFPGRDWQLAAPPYGAGQEAYFAQAGDQALFVKLGVQVERYQVMDALGLAPQLARVERRWPARKTPRGITFPKSLQN